MRYWISSDHFPEEMRINILSTPNEQALSLLDDEQKSVLKGLTTALHNCQWDAESIGGAIPQAAKDMEYSPRSAYRAAYAALMGLEKGPRLAPILAEMDKKQIMNLLDSCCQLL
jgi:lysyl-tRNA synthetase class 1